MEAPTLIAPSAQDLFLDFRRELVRFTQTNDTDSVVVWDYDSCRDYAFQADSITQATEAVTKLILALGLGQPCLASQTGDGTTITTQRWYCSSLGITILVTDWQRLGNGLLERTYQVKFVRIRA